MMRAVLVAVLLGACAPALADAPPVTATPSAQAHVESTLAAAPKGTRFGLLVVDDAGNVIASVNPDQRFIPASNTKMFTTAAAYALLPGMDNPDAAGGTQVFLVATGKKAPPDVLLYGQGDARMSGAADCQSDCLTVLADAVSAKTRSVRNVVGDDTLFVRERWSPGMSWNNFGSNDATATSALSLDDGELTVRVTPGEPGKPPLIAASGYPVIHNEALTIDAVPGAQPAGKLVLDHEPNSRDFRLHGFIPVGAGEWRELIGIDDPADYAAWRLAEMLRQRGVRVTGKVSVVHREPQVADPRNMSGGILADQTHAQRGAPLASLAPPPLALDVAIINKVSQNNHAELLLRRIARQAGGNGLADGLTAEQDLFARAGIPREGYDFSDGSGMSTYNRVSPRAAVALLRWIDTQPWGKEWYASLPIAGVDGTLKRRFVGTPLEGNLAAKTGTLNATNALSGTFRAASGKRLTFAFFANDVPNGESAIPAMEATLLVIAAAN